MLAGSASCAGRRGAHLLRGRHLLLLRAGLAQLPHILGRTLLQRRGARSHHKCVQLLIHTPGCGQRQKQMARSFSTTVKCISNKHPLLWGPSTACMPAPSACARAGMRDAPATGGRVRDSRGTIHAGVRPGLARAPASARRHLMQERGGGSVPRVATQPMAMYLRRSGRRRWAQK